jgi:hypothetical protein
VAHGELLQMFKMPTVKVQALFTVGENCVTYADQSFSGCVCAWMTVVGLYSTLNSSGNPMSRSRMKLSLANATGIQYFVFSLSTALGNCHLEMWESCVMLKVNFLIFIQLMNSRFTLYLKYDSIILHH